MNDFYYYFDNIKIRENIIKMLKCVEYFSRKINNLFNIFSLNNLLMHIFITFLKQIKKQ